MRTQSSIGIAHPASRQRPGPRHCEQTGLTIPECSCPVCWARMQAREDVRRIMNSGSTLEVALSAPG
jgi:hypothetical protein